MTLERQLNSCDCSHLGLVFARVTHLSHAAHFTEIVLHFVWPLFPLEHKMTTTESQFVHLPLHLHFKVSWMCTEYTKCFQWVSFYLWGCFPTIWNSLLSKKKRDTVWRYLQCCSTNYVQLVFSKNEKVKGSEMYRRTFLPDIFVQNQLSLNLY